MILLIYFSIKFQDTDGETVQPMPTKYSNSLLKKAREEIEEICMYAFRDHFRPLYIDHVSFVPPSPLF